MATSSPKLTPISYVVLGLLDAGGPATSYDLEQGAAVSVGHFWSFPRSQLYSEPARLAAAGLLVQESEAAGRRRRVLTITAAGRTALQDWLRVEEGHTTEIRDLGLLRLFFGASASEETDVRRNARAQLQAHRAHLLAYEELAGLTDLEPHQRATLRLGLAYEQVAVALWEEVAAGRT